MPHPNPTSFFPPDDADTKTCLTHLLNWYLNNRPLCRHDTTAILSPKYTFPSGLTEEIAEFREFLQMHNTNDQAIIDAMHLGSLLNLDHVEFYIELKIEGRPISEG